MRELVSVPAGELLSSGIFKLPGASPSIWADGYNVQFRDGGVRSGQGTTLVSAITARPTGMASAYAAERRLYFGAGANYYKYTTGAGVVQIGSQTAVGGIWVFVPFGSNVVASNGADMPHLWPNTGSGAAISTAPFTRAAAMAKFGAAYMLAANTNISGDTIYNCDFGDPDDWTNGQAGQQQIYDLNSPIMQFVPLGDAMGVYTQDELFQYYYNGTGSRFSYQRLIQGIGTDSPHGVVATPRGHFGFGSGRLFGTNGADFGFIDEPAVQTYVEENYDPDRATLVYGWHDRANAMVRWYLPTADDFIGLGYRYMARSWTHFEDDFSVAEGQGVWSVPFFANTSQLRQAGGDPTSYLQSKPIDCGDRQRAKLFQMLELDLVWSGSVEITLGYCDGPLDAISWETAQPAATKIYPETDGGREANHIVFKITGTGSWQLHRFSVHGEAGGHQR